MPGISKQNPNMLFRRQTIFANPPRRSNKPHLKKVVVVQLVAVLHDVALDLAGIDPSDKVFHPPILHSDSAVRVEDTANLVTRYAGSVMVSGPTLIWPCSMNLAAALTVSAILLEHITTASLLLQNFATLSVFSTSLNFASEFSKPIS